MKKHFDRGLRLFLSAVLLFAFAMGLACTASAEEWIEEIDVFEEPGIPDVGFPFPESGNFIVLEEELSPASASNSADQNGEESILPMIIETEQEGQDLLIITEDQTVAEQTIIEEAADADDAGDTARITEEKAGTETEAAAGSGENPELSLSTGENAAFAAAQSETGISFYGTLNTDGNLDFCVTLPEGTEKASCTITADDGQGGTETFENKAGETEITVFSNVKPCQLTEKMCVNIVCQGKELQYNILDYLRQIPGQFADLDISQLVPANKAQCSGAIEGVYDWHAKLDLTEDDTAIVIFFRAPDVENLRFSAEGHSLTSPERVGNELWSVRLTGITVKELPTDFTITAEKDGQKLQLRFSPFCDAAAHWTEDTPVVLLCKALTAVMADAERNSTETAQT